MSPYPPKRNDSRDAKTKKYWALVKKETSFHSPKIAARTATIEERAGFAVVAVIVTMHGTYRGWMDHPMSHPMGHPVHQANCNRWHCFEVTQGRVASIEVPGLLLPLPNFHGFHFFAPKQILAFATPDFLPVHHDELMKNHNSSWIPRVLGLPPF